MTKKNNYAILKQENDILGNQNIENNKKGIRYKVKKVKLNIFMFSENNTNVLSPILGQYGIKPLDFLQELRQKFKVLKSEPLTEEVSKAFC